MGHERLGALPKTKPWREIVKLIASKPGAPRSELTATIAQRTLQNVRSRFDRMHLDQGVCAAFAFLVKLASKTDQGGGTLTAVDPGLDQDPGPVRLAARLNEWVRRHTESSEYAELSRRAGGDVIAAWTQEQRAQGKLFSSGNASVDTWESAANAASFCELGRLFLSKFTERYLRYFLEREASAQFDQVAARERFGAQLQGHVDQVSQHAFETAKIAQSFAAGWYNKHARDALPTDRAITSFLRLSLQKIREELLREGSL